jgi:glycopeptide antibiotics resistance protein
MHNFHVIMHSLSFQCCHAISTFHVIMHRTYDTTTLTILFFKLEKGLGMIWKSFGHSSCICIKCFPAQITHLISKKAEKQTRKFSR